MGPHRLEYLVGWVSGWVAVYVGRVGMVLTISMAISDIM